MAKIILLSDIKVSKAEPWRIDGVLSGLTVLWGEPGVGKSFVAMSMAASVSAGLPWVGKKTSQGCVVYVAGEGGETNVAIRLNAALKEWGIETKPYVEVYGMDPEDYEWSPGDLEDLSPIYVVTPGVNLVPGPSELTDLVGIDPPIHPKLIIVDTLSRCFVGDENKQEDMGKFVKSLDLLRHHYESDILVIHHANRQHEIRGSSVLYGAADVSWHLTKTPTHLNMVSDKLRERSPDNGSIRLRTELSVIEGMYDEFGAKQTTLIVKPHKEDIRNAKKIQDIGLGMLAIADSIRYDDLFAALNPMPKTEFNNALSIILTYPGRWGITKAPEIGTFKKTSKHPEDDKVDW